MGWSWREWNFLTTVGWNILKWVEIGWSWEERINVHLPTKQTELKKGKGEKELWRQDTLGD